MLDSCRRPPAVRDGVVDEAVIEQISKEVEQARGLHFTHKVEIDVVTQAVASDRIKNATIKELGGETRVEPALEAGADLGLFKRSCKCSNRQFLEITAHSAATITVAFTESEDRIDVVEDGSERLGQQIPILVTATGLLDRPIDFLTGRLRLSDGLLTNALARALIYQNFPYQSKSDQLPDNYDAYHAYNAVVQGDTLLIAGTVSRGLANIGDLCNERSNGVGWWEGLLGRAQVNLLGTSQFKLLLPSFAVLLSDIQTDETFVCRAYKSGGLASVDDLYKKIPYSMQQIYEPNRYFGSVAAPIRITVSGYQEVLPDWVKVYDDSFGPSGLRSVLENESPRSLNVVELADHWAGDHLVGLKKDKDFSVLWIIAFQDIQAAKTFSSDYRLAQTFSALNVPTRVARNAAAVMVVVGAAANQFDQLAAEVWKKTAIGPDPHE